MSESETTDQYKTLLQDISSLILQSRYRAARLVNRELLLLYLAVGKRLAEKVAAEKCLDRFPLICRSSYRDCEAFLPRI